MSKDINGKTLLIVGDESIGDKIRRCIEEASKIPESKTAIDYTAPEYQANAIPSPDKIQGPVEIENKDEVIYYLWKLLDDLDTIEDMSGSRDDVFRKLAFATQQRRHNILTESQVQNLYDKYYKADEDILPVDEGNEMV
jgi:hypothetical protein